MITNSHGRWLNSPAMMALLGFKPTQPIPSGYEATHEVQGVQIHVLQRPVEGRSKHRVFYSCPTCDQLVPFGRWHQHIKGRSHKGGREVYATVLEGDRAPQR